MEEIKSKAGRKKIDPKKRIVQAYYFVEQGVLDSVGKDVAKEIARKAVERKAALK